MSNLADTKRGNQNLSEASAKYMRGEIDLEKYEEVERQNMTDYRAVVRALNGSGKPPNSNLLRQMRLRKTLARLMKSKGN